MEEKTVFYNYSENCGAQVSLVENFFSYKLSNIGRKCHGFNICVLYDTQKLKRAYTDDLPSLTNQTTKKPSPCNRHILK